MPRSARTGAAVTLYKYVDDGSKVENEMVPSRLYTLKIQHTAIANCFRLTDAIYTQGTSPAAYEFISDTRL